MDEITLHGGIHDTRKLVSAYATLMLRKRGVIRDDGSTAIRGKRYMSLSERKWRAWHPDDVKEAKRLHGAGLHAPAIAAALNRSKQSVYFKLRRSA